MADTVILVYLSITWRARDELENYARSEDALGESTVDRPRRLEIVDDPHTMPIVPAILQGRLHHQIPFYQGCRFVLIDLRRKICRKSEEEIARKNETALTLGLTKFIRMYVLIYIKSTEQITIIIY